jgi:ribonucleoside-triphosphate reductase
MDKKDPMSKLMVDLGFPHEDEITHPDSVMVFSFPQKAPDNALVQGQLSPIEHMQLWKTYQDFYCEHKPSVTINIKEHEWMQVGDWVYQNYESISGISFLPHSEHIYQQAPYQKCYKEDYDALLVKLPTHVDWLKLSDYEKEDSTKGTQELSCSAGVCEI